MSFKKRFLIGIIIFLALFFIMAAIIFFVLPPNIVSVNPADKSSNVSLLFKRKKTVATTLIKTLNLQTAEKQ